MKYLKKILKKIGIISVEASKTEKPFFTKDIFKNTKYCIGDYSYGKPKVLFENEKANLFIGKFCSISENVTIFLGGNHRVDWLSTYPFNDLPTYFPEASNIIGHPDSKGDVIIKNDVWIGLNVVIMSGITIGDGAVIAAGSLLTKDVGDYEIWGGNPAILLKKRFEEPSIKKLQQLKWWDWDIDKIKEHIPLLCSNDIELI
tara:strand:+ start:51082 stop:51684 length:603 start_codon:yes stop_codon:yes gene_type:complete